MAMHIPEIFYGVKFSFSLSKSSKHLICNGPVPNSTLLVTQILPDHCMKELTSDPKSCDQNNHAENKKQQLFFKYFINHVLTVQYDRRPEDSSRTNHRYCHPFITLVHLLRGPSITPDPAIFDQTGSGKCRTVSEYSGVIN